MGKVRLSSSCLKCPVLAKCTHQTICLHFWSLQASNQSQHPRQACTCNRLQHLNVPVQGQLAPSRNIIKTCHNAISSNIHNASILEKRRVHSMYTYDTRQGTAPQTYVLDLCVCASHADFWHVRNACLPVWTLPHLQLGTGNIAIMEGSACAEAQVLRLWPQNLSFGMWMMDNDKVAECPTNHRRHNLNV